MARIGGDEFVVLMVEGADMPPQTAVERLAESVQVWQREAGKAWAAVFDLSIGVAECADIRACDLDELIDQADRAMYAQKRLRQATRRRAG